MSFFFSIVYLIAEYMRPQSMYDAISDLPLAQIAIIGIIVAFILEGRKLNNFNFLNIFLLAYLFWFFISYLFAFRPELAWQPLIDFTKWVVIYFLLANIINDKRKLYIFIIVFLLLNFKYAQFAFRIWVKNGFYIDPRGLYEGGGIGAGFFKNPNDFGVALNSVLGISFYMIFSDMKKIFNRFKMRWFHIIATLTILLAILTTSSRGAVLALGAVSIGIWFKSKRKFIGIAVLIIATTMFISLIPEDNWARFQGMGSEQDKTGRSRIELSHAGIRMANEHPLTGVGPNNYVFVNENIYHNDLHVVQHNVFIQAVSELGYPGLTLFLMMIFSCFCNNRKTRRILQEKQIDDSFLYGLSHGLDISLIGFIVNGFFITVLYYPFFWMLMILSVALLDTAKRLEKDNIENNPIYNG
jgi:putative inorganic carbon (hco3(-)) transporter